MPWFTSFSSQPDGGRVTIDLALPRPPHHTQKQGLFNTTQTEFHRITYFPEDRSIAFPPAPISCPTPFTVWQPANIAAVRIPIHTIMMIRPIFFAISFSFVVVKTVLFLYQILHCVPDRRGNRARYQIGRRPWMIRTRTMTMAITRRRWMNPRIACDVINPSPHSTNKMTAMVIMVSPPPCDRYIKIPDPQRQMRVLLFHIRINRFYRAFLQTATSLVSVEISLPSR
jgi:hypothetical protein